MKAYLVVIGAYFALIAGITLGLWAFDIPPISETGFIAYFFPTAAFIMPHLIGGID